MRYYIITGEASGDLHASNLMKELKRIDPEASFRFWGGDHMVKQGGELVKHIRETSFMGFTEVVLHLRKIRNLIKLCRRDIYRYQPDALILIDYPGFNLRIAAFARKQGLRVIYYISPQVWAWKASRVEKIKSSVDRLYVILPFEKTFYDRYRYPVEYVGHPLLDAIEPSAEKSSPSFRELNHLDDRPIIALLPGSRKQEINRTLPLMLAVIPRFPDFQFVVAGLSINTPPFYGKINAGQTVHTVYDQTYDLLKDAHAALVTSGTATLETALFRIPQVICYKGESISYQIAKRLVRVPHIGLVNLIMEKEIVKELIQNDLNPANLTRELQQIVEEGTTRDRVLHDYTLLKQKLGSKGASSRTARLIYDYLSKIKKS